jgi:hypothetical protein
MPNFLATLTLVHGSPCFFEVIKINCLRQDGFIRLFISAGLRRRMLGGKRGLGDVRFGFYFGSG